MSKFIKGFKRFWIALLAMSMLLGVGLVTAPTASASTTFTRSSTCATSDGHSVTIKQTFEIDGTGNYMRESAWSFTASNLAKPLTNVRLYYVFKATGSNSWTITIPGSLYNGTWLGNWNIATWYTISGPYTYTDAVYVQNGTTYYCRVLHS